VQTRPSHLLVAVVCVVCVVGLAGCGETDPGSERGEGSVTGKRSAVIADVTRIAPALETWLRGGEYPTTLDAARQALTDAALEPSPGNAVGGYRYEPDSVEFRLCIEAAGGAYAIYDTRPMSVLTSGDDGGCPAA